MADTPAVQSEPRLDPAPSPAATSPIVDAPQKAALPARADAPPRRLPLSVLLGLVAGLVGVAALGASAWVYGETKREMLRISTDIAQLRLSLDLYSQRSGAAPAATGADAGADGLLDLSNRLAILEAAWREGTAAAAPAALPPLPATTESAGAGASCDCLPTGMRFMVSAGDSYPVCGTEASVAIGAVDNGFISLADGTVIAQGGAIALPGSTCLLGVMPSDGGTISGFAEIRVTC